MSDITKFVIESNRIEGILREPWEAEIVECERFLALDVVTVEELRQFVSVYQPNARLRNQPGLNVRVGNHYPPQGGAEIEHRLNELLVWAEQDDPENAYRTHILYETLHPFTDGNGRSGRMLWAWQMQDLRLGFLPAFYYQTLRYGGGR